MLILHCARKADWDAARALPDYGRTMCERGGFIHCSPVCYFWRVAPNFRSDPDERILLLIDPARLASEIRWEDGGDGAIRLYPHVFGPINREAIVATLPYLRDAGGDWIRNPELADITDE